MAFTHEVYTKLSVRVKCDQQTGISGWEEPTLRLTFAVIRCEATKYPLSHVPTSEKSRKQKVFLYSQGSQRGEGEGGRRGLLGKGKTAKLSKYSRTF